MLKNIKAAGIFFLFLTLAVFAPSRASYADHWSVGVSVGGPGYYHDDGRRNWGWHDHPHYGWHMHYLPAGAFVIWVDGSRYYYSDGLYYSYAGDGDYVLVNPPVGAYVSAIPSDFQPVIVGGRTYYASEGVYYVMTPRGYRVVSQPVIYEPPPVVVAQPQPVTVVAAPVVTAQYEFTINVPNNGGSYTPVVVKRSGNGYVGPQGEFYPQFPSVAQLKAMYSK